MKPGRNDPCNCGSGKKFKHCCEGKVASRSAAPPPDVFNQLVALFKGGRYAELEGRTQVLLGQYPDAGLIWKLLGASRQMQGKDALEAFRKVVELMPNDPDAHYNLGNALKDIGQFDNAASSYRRVLKMKPDFAEAHNNLGITLRNLGQIEEAVASCRRALEIKPNLAEAHNNMGIALRDLLQYEDAVKSLRRAVEIKPDYAEAYNNMGSVLRDFLQYEDAVRSLRRAVEIKPDYAEAHNNMGIVLHDMGLYSDAVTSCRRAVEIKPDFAEAYFNLGGSLREIGHLNEALSCCRHAVKIKPDSSPAHVILGLVLQDLDQYEDALTSFRRALECAPDCYDAMLCISHLHLVNGEKEKAKEFVNMALKIKPENLEAHFQLASINKARPGDENLAILLSAAEAVKNGQRVLKNKQAISLHFSLGKSFDDLREYDRAFPHFLEGCRLKRATIEYDAVQMAQRFSDVMQVFDQATIDRLRGGGNLSEVPIFVLGMPRSGTTLTEQIIASHPDVYGAGELFDLRAIAHRNVAGVTGFPDNIRVLDQAVMNTWANDYVEGLRQRAPDASRITDKLPGNFWHLGLIHLMLPNAKIIHVNRNPVDTCLSCFTNLFSGALNQTYDLSELGQYYVGYARLMDHWRKILSAGAFLEVQYEDIVADQEGQARRLIDYCGLEWNDACIDFHKTKRSVSTASITQVRQPIYGSSVERWRSYEKYLGSLLDALGDLAPRASREGGK